NTASLLSLGRAGRAPLGGIEQEVYGRRRRTRGTRRPGVADSRALPPIRTLTVGSGITPDPPVDGFDRVAGCRPLRAGSPPVRTFTEPRQRVVGTLRVSHISRPWRPLPATYLTASLRSRFAAVPCHRP